MNSLIILSKNMKIDKEHKNVLNYSNEQYLNIMQQPEYFLGRSDNYSFIQESENEIVVNFPYSECVIANYMAFQNPNYSTKWFFAFVDEVTFYSEFAIKIKFTIDNWATWFEKIDYRPCYVLREHVKDDSIGANRVDENLNVGEIDCIFTTNDASLSDFSYICVLSAWKPEDKTGYNGISVYNGSVFGKLAMLFSNNNYGWEDLLYYILQTNADGHISDMTDMFIIPASLVNPSQLIEHTFVDDFRHEEHTYYTMQFSDSSKTYITPIQKAYGWGDYVPKNNKLYCYPYNYLLVTNNNGNQAIYKYEEFSTDNVQIQTELSFSIGVSGRAVPLHYKGMAIDDDESLPLGKYPTCSWSADSYTNWLTQQAVNMPTQFLSLLTSKVNPTSISDVGNLATQIGSIIGSFYSASLLPEIQGGGNTSDVVFNSKRNTFTYRAMRCRVEFLNIIDDYFTRFGYQINRVKLPDINGRPEFNYLEIGQGENFAYGEIPANSLLEINQIARNGVTIWHNHQNIGNYLINNH